MPNFEIPCSRTSSCLRLSQLEATGRGAYDESHFLVELESEGLAAKCEISDIVSTAWVDFFDDLAEQWKGWSDSRSVKSVEGHVAFIATCDALGHVTFVAKIHETPLYKGWAAALPLHLELGQLEALAKCARSFFSLERAG